MKVLVLSTLLLQTLNAQTDSDFVMELAPSETDLSTFPAGTADVMFDPATTDAEFGADATAGPGFTFSVLSAIETPVEEDEPTSVVVSTFDEATPALEMRTATDMESAAAPDATVLPFDEECPASCYEGSNKLRRRQDVPSSNGGFAAFQWPGDRATAQDDDCTDDLPDWLLESSGRTREACQPVQRQDCPDICYEATPGNTAQGEGDYYGDDDNITEGYEESVTIPYTEEPYTEEPYTEEPYTEEPYTEEPYTEEPYTEEPYTEEPYTEEPYTEEPYTEDPYGEDTTTEEYYDETTLPGYGDDSTTKGYPDYNTKPTSYGNYSTTTPAGGYGYGQNPPTTLVTSTKPADGGYGSPGYEGSTIAGICPKQCNPFDPAQNKCDTTTSCSTTGNNKYYCACRAGFRASAWNPRDFTKQFKFASQPYVYVAPGEVCNTVCSDQTCTEVMMRPACQ